MNAAAVRGGFPVIPVCCHSLSLRGHSSALQSESHTYSCGRKVPVFVLDSGDPPPNLSDDLEQTMTSFGNSVLHLHIEGDDVGVDSHVLWFPDIYPPSSHIRFTKGGIRGGGP